MQNIRERDDADDLDDDDDDEREDAYELSSTATEPVKSEVAATSTDQVPANIKPQDPVKEDSKVAEPKATPEKDDHQST